MSLKEFFHSVRRNPFPIAVLFAGVLLVYGQTVGFDLLLWDDYINITSNGLMYLPPQEALPRFWSEPFFQMFIPVTYTIWYTVLHVSSWFVGSLLGAGTVPAAAFHFLNVLFHFLNAVIVFALFSRILNAGVASRDPSRPLHPSSVHAALLGALVFALHPLQIEIVACVSNLRDLLGFFFAGLALLVPGVIPALSPSLDPALGAGRCPEQLTWRRYAVATFFFVLALLSKPSTVIFPGVILILRLTLRLIPRATTAREAVLSRPRLLLAEVWAWFKPMALWLLLGGIVAHLTSRLQPPLREDFVAPLSARPLLLLDTLGFSASKLFFPYPLHTDYGRSPRWLLESGDYTWTLPLALLVVVALVACLRAARSAELRATASPARLLLAALLIWLLAYLPVSGLFFFTFMSISTVTDRYSYLPLFAAGLACATLALRLRGRVLHQAWLLPLIGLSLLSVPQVARWRDTRSIFEWTVQWNPKSAFALNNLSIAAPAGSPEQEEHLKRSMALGPRETVAHENLANLYARRGEFDRAIQILREAITSHPERTVPRTRLSMMLLELNRNDEAARELKALLALNPQNPQAWFFLSEAQQRLGLAAERLESLRRAVAADPGNAQLASALRVAERTLSQ